MWMERPEKKWAGQDNTSNCDYGSDQISSVPNPAFGDFWMTVFSPIGKKFPGILETGYVGCS